MLTIEFNDAEERTMKAMTKKAEDIEFKKNPTETDLRHFQILQNAVARIIQRKMEQLPWN